MEQKTIGKIIAVLRKSQGMTQRELAEKLGVSDKTVSHWERDESAPDISLIPVIAKIFSVTCDELLRGEKSPKLSEAFDTYSDNGLSEKGEKQIKYLFERALSRLKMKSIICIGIDAVGFLVGGIIIADHLRRWSGTKIEYYGLLCAAIFYIVSFTLAGVFRFQFGISVKSNDFEPSQSYTKKANFITFLTAGFTAIVFCCTLPVCTQDTWIIKRLAHGFLYVSICVAILVIIFVLLEAKGFVPSEQHTKKQKKLWLLRVIIADITVFLLTGEYVTTKIRLHINEPFFNLAVILLAVLVYALVSRKIRKGESKAPC